LAAEVADRLGLTFHSQHTADLLTDKLKQRAAFERRGIPVPVFTDVRAGDISVDFPFPAVLKPRTGAGSRDTFRVENTDEVDEVLARCSPTEEFILEEWLADRDRSPRLSSDIVSVESVVRDGEIEHLIVTGRFPFAPPFRETGLYLPSELTAVERDDVFRLASAAAIALQIQHGILHTEIKLTPSGPRVIEVNGRQGGGISQLIRRVGGPSIILWALRLALGLDVGPIPTFAPSPISFLLLVVAPVSATSLVSVSGVDELRELAGVSEIRRKLLPGNAVSSRRSSWSDHAIRVDGIVDSYAELFSLIHEKIPSTLHLTWGGE
jgi:biotin carboxylase